MPTDTQDENSNSPVKKRSQYACDACRARKVKCAYAEDATSCQQCLGLQVSCTQDKPRRRRGPPSRYVEAQKKQRLDHTLSIHIPAIHATNGAKPHQQNAVSSKSILSPIGNTSGGSSSFDLHLSPGVPHGFSLDQLAPALIIQQAIQDWFELVHPAAPLLHRGTFLRELNDPASSENIDFLLLVVSICAATVSTLRRRTAPYAGFITVEKCQHIVSTVNRRRGLLPVSLVRCQTMYNLICSFHGGGGMDDGHLQLQLAEVTAMVAHLLHYEVETSSLIDRELIKRLYWLIVAAQCTMGLHGRPFMVPLTVSTEATMLKPREITDAELGPVSSGEELWHGNTTSYIPGLNTLSNLFMVWYRSQQGDCSSLSHLQEYMDLVMSALDYVSPSLRWRGGLSRPPRSNFGTDVQMVNLYITQIHIRSFLLDQMYRVVEQQNDSLTMAEVMTARQNLVDDMLAIVYQMPEDTLEANGNSLLSKLRDIGLALLHENNSPATSLANLDRLLVKLDRLDVRPGSQIDTHSPAVSMTSPYSLP